MVDEPELPGVWGVMMFRTGAYRFRVERPQSGSSVPSIDPDTDQTSLPFFVRLPRIARFIALSGAVAAVSAALAGPGIANDEIEHGRLETSFDVAQQIPATVEPGRIEDAFKEKAQPKSTFEPMIEEGEEMAPPAEARSVTFTLASIVVEGSTVYEPGDFLPLYEELVGTEISLADVYKVASAISAKYRSDGYILSRAIVPPQTIEGGQVKLQAVEGYINEVIIEGDIAGRESLLNAYAQNIVSARPLNAAQLERYLLLADDLPGVTAKAVLTPSVEAPGASDLVLFIEHKHVDIAVGADNRGSKFAGPYQASLLIDLNSPFGLYDRTRGRAIVASQSEELRFLEITHDEILGSEGTRLILAYTISRSNPGSTLKPFKIESDNEKLVVLVSHPLIRSRSRNLSIRGQFDYISSESKILGTDLFSDRLRVLRVGASYDFIDDFRGINLIDAEFSQGLDILNESQPNIAKNTNANLSRLNGKTDFSKVNLEYSRLQYLSFITPGLNLLGSVIGQYAFSQLLSGEEFGVGGDEFGRAYDPSEITGDHGLSGKLELQWGQNVAYEDFEVLAGYQLFVFYDLGAVWRIDPFDRVSVASVGAGVRFNLWDNVSGLVEVAKPLTRDVAARGADGNEGRVFFNVGARF